MATFIDEGDEPTNDFEQTNEEELNLESASEEQPEETVPEEPPEEDIPDKYKGKSIKDIVRMHQEAEKALGRQGSEVGELRRVVDTFIQSQTVKQQQAPEVEEEVDFFVDPDKAIEHKIANHPTVRQAQQLAAQMKKAEALANLKTAHPDFQTILETSDFTDWVNKSRVRQELFNRADKSYDFEAADELLSTWKERTSVVKQAKEMEQISRKQSVKAAATGAAKGSGEASSKKIYRRQDIIELMRTNPERYMQLEPEIRLAYEERRVR